MDVSKAKDKKKSDRNTDRCIGVINSAPLRSDAREGGMRRREGRGRLEGVHGGGEAAVQLQRGVKSRGHEDQCVASLGAVNLRRRKSHPVCLEVIRVSAVTTGTGEREAT
jgi:hypothetical protein